MLHVRRKYVARCTQIALLGAIIAGCDSTLAPEVQAPGPPKRNCLEPFSEPMVQPVEQTNQIIMPCGGGGGGWNPPPPPPPPPPAPERLVFSGLGDMETYIASLEGATSDQLAAAEQQRGLGMSLRAYLDNGEETQSGADFWYFTDGPTANEATALQSDGVTREDFPVSDAFLSLLNKKGEMQVGDSIYKVTRDNVYAVIPANLALLDQLVPTLNAPAPAPDPRISVAPVTTTAPSESAPEGPLTSSAPGGPSFHHIPGVGRDCYAYAGNFRMHGKSYISNYVIYSEAGVFTDWERKKKFLGWTFWSNTWQPGTLSHIYDGQLSFGPWSGPWSYVGPGIGNHPPKTGTAGIYSPLRRGVGFGVRIRGTIHARHSISSSALTASCNTTASA